MSFFQPSVSLLAVSLCCSQLQAQKILPPKPGVLGNTIPARPLTIREKFDYRLFRGFLLRGAIGAAFSAGIAQATNTSEEWGQGAQGYGKRYASSLGNSAVRQALEFGIEASLHQDTRYFPSTDKGFKARFENVVKQVFVTRTDDGGTAPAYGRLVSAFAAGQIANSWQPASNNTVGDGLIRGAFSIAADAGINFASEFFPAIRKRLYKMEDVHPQSP